MISNHLNLVEQQRQHADSISERTAQFLAAGGTIYQHRSRNHSQAPQAAHHTGRA
ncbi:hypothetical protein [Pseudomonas cyclaminis]|uniref:hypothetical protein n=1 Tax=Pseudomonas cyclaminis TaxID=2781239 RepID=UPI0037F9B8CD